MSNDETITANQRKGRRHENEARRILDRTYRFASRATDTASASGTTDLFNCADLIAVRPGWPVKFVQVKTNSRQFNPSWMPLFVDGEHTQFELWSRFDREGWEIRRYVPTDDHFCEYELILEVESCDEDRIAEQYRDHIHAELGAPDQ